MSWMPLSFCVQAAEEGVAAPLLDAFGVRGEGAEVDMGVDVITAGLSEVLAPKFRVEKNVVEGSS